MIPGLQTDIEQEKAITSYDFQRLISPLLPKYNFNVGKFYNKSSNQVTLFSNEVTCPGWVFIVLGNRVYHLKVISPELLLKADNRNKCCIYPFIKRYFEPVTEEYIKQLINPKIIQENIVKPTTDTFEEFVNKELDIIKQLLVRKSSEYAVEKNKFINFDDAAEFNDETPERALWGFLTKHLISVKHIVMNWDKEGIFPTPDMLAEKIRDIQLYCLLLHAMFLRDINLSNK